MSTTEKYDSSTYRPSRTYDSSSDQMNRPMRTLEKLESPSEPLYVALLNAVVAGIITAIIYYTTYNFFDSTSALGNLGWVSTSNGLFVMLLAFLFAAGAAVAFGMAFTSNLMSYGLSLLLNLLILVMFYLIITSANDGTRVSFWLFSLVMLALGVVGAGYGLWSTWSMRTAMGKARERFWWAAGASVVALIAGIGLVAAEFKLSEVFP